jgi:heptosyltransferase-1
VSRILIIKPSSLGDVVHALPVLAALRAAYPDAYIAWLVGTAFVDLLEPLAGRTAHSGPLPHGRGSDRLLDEVIPFDRHRYGKMWWNPVASLDFWKFVYRIRKRRFDLIVDLQGLIRSGLLSWFSGAKQRIGFADAREGAWLFYTQRVRCPDAAEHAVERNLCVARTLGLHVAEPKFPLEVRDQERADARAMLAAATDGRLPERFTAILPGARWPSKIWPAERFAELIDWLERPPAHRCVLLGAPSDRETAAEIRRLCNSRPIDLVGRTTLRQLTALLSLAEHVYCGDSGPMHVAAALARQLTALFGPTNPRKTGPYSPHARIVTNPVPCAPCYRRVCPLGHHDCLHGLGIDKVLPPVRETTTARA